MTSKVQRFIEKRINLLENDLSAFLYNAIMILDTKDCEELATILDTANISYENVIEDVIKEIFTKELSKQYSDRDRIVVSQYISDFPHFNLTRRQIKELLYSVLESVNAHVKIINGLEIISWE